MYRISILLLHLVLSERRTKVISVRRSDCARHSLRERHDRPDLDASKTGTRDLGRDGDSLVETAGLDQVVAGELFLGLGEWPIGCERLAIAHTNGRCGVGRLQRVAALDR